VIIAFVFVILIIVYKFARADALVSKELRISLQALQLMALFSSITSNWPPQVIALFSVLSFSVSIYNFCYCMITYLLEH
jgi:hypothetical protein